MPFSYPTISPTVLSIGTNQSVTQAERGAANSSLTFFRSLGMTVGITVFGIIQRNLLTHQINNLLASDADAGKCLQGLSLKALLTPERREHIPRQLLAKMTDALDYSLTHMFMWLFLPTALILIFACRMSSLKRAAANHAA